jgi:hypothetical protein
MKHGCTILNQKQAAINGMTPCKLAQEKEIQICAFSRKSYGYGLF